MEKQLLTSEGMATVQAALYKQDDEYLRQEAASLSEDALGWIAERFELTVTQLELLRNAGPGLMVLVGYSIALAILTRSPVAINGLQSFLDIQPIAVGATATIHCNLSLRYIPGGCHADGEVRVNLAPYRPSG